MKKYGKFIVLGSAIVSCISLFLPMAKSRFIGEIRGSAFDILGQENSFAAIVAIIGMIIAVCAVWAGKKWLGLIGIVPMIWFAIAMYMAVMNGGMRGTLSMDIGYILYILGMIGCGVGIVMA